jgi:O-antigen/teichoic acid export membrane protein
MKYKANTDLRSKMLNKNIVISVFLQGISIIVSLILLPLSLNFVSIEQYGVWLAINSILMWTSYFGLGLGSGLKNSLGEALAHKNYKEAKQLISTAYFIMISIMGFLSLLYYFFSDGINWVTLFKLNILDDTLIHRTINIVIYLFLLRFILELVNVIMDAMQKLYFAKINSTISQLSILLTILLLSYVTEGDILKLGIIFSGIPVLILLITSIWLFTKHPHLSPSLSYVKLNLSRNLYGIGLKFFIIQLCQIFLFQTTNILIIRNFGPQEVVQYNVVYSLFSMISVGFATISAPYWSAYVNAWTLKDIEWIVRTNQRLIKLWLLIVCLALIILLFSDQIYYWWLGRDLNIPFSLSLSIFAYMCVFSFSGIYNMFINGVGKLKLQIISLTISTILYFPILWFFVKVLDWGLLSFPLALLVISNYTLIIAPMQFKKLVNGTAKGIWNK